MANWKFTIRLKDIRDAYKANEFSIEEFGQKVAERIEKSIPEWFHDETLKSIVEGFKEHCEDLDDFNTQLEALYNWGDEVLDTESWPHKKKAWIGFTF